MLYLSITLAGITLLTCNSLLAARIYSCEDSSGHLTFTTQGCNNQQTQQILNNRPTNTTVSTPAPTQLATPKLEKKLVVVGELDDGCGNRLTASQRRTALIKQQVPAGMTLEHVERALGRPDRISRHNGRTRYYFNSRSGNTQQVNFDQDGCSE